MPAHINAFTKLQVFGTFLKVNLDPRKKAKIAREGRIGVKHLRNRKAGTPDAANNRAAYVPLGFLMETAQTEAEHKLSSLSKLFTNYEGFRTILDRMDPAAYVNGGLYTSQTEWDLYLSPGTEFDGQCALYFEAKRGPMRVHFHKSNVHKPKRIEALPRDSAPVTLWTDAS